MVSFEFSFFPHIPPTYPPRTHTFLQLNLSCCQDSGLDELLAWSNTPVPVFPGSARLRSFSACKSDGLGIRFSPQWAAERCMSHAHPFMTVMHLLMAWAVEENAVKGVNYLLQNISLSLDAVHWYYRTEESLSVSHAFPAWAPPPRCKLSCGQSSPMPPSRTDTSHNAKHRDLPITTPYGNVACSLLTSLSDFSRH